MEVVIGCIVLVAAIIKVIIDQIAYEKKKREEAYLKKLTPYELMEYEQEKAYLKKLEEERQAYLKKLEEEEEAYLKKLDYSDMWEYFQAKREQLEQLEQQQEQQELEPIREVARQNAIKEFRQEQPKKVPPPLPRPSKEKEEKWYKEGTRWSDVYSEGKQGLFSSFYEGRK